MVRVTVQYGAVLSIRCVHALQRQMVCADMQDSYYTVLHSITQ